MNVPIPPSNRKKKLKIIDDPPQNNMKMAQH
jgi:hypothetical protein